MSNSRLFIQKLPLQGLKKASNKQILKLSEFAITEIPKHTFEWKLFACRVQCVSYMYISVALVACTYSHTKCYVCSDVGGSCADRYSISSHEQDCSDWGFLDDGGCSKYKHRIKVLGTWLISSEWAGIAIVIVGIGYAKASSCLVPEIAGITGIV